MEREERRKRWREKRGGKEGEEGRGRGREGRRGGKREDEGEVGREGGREDNNHHKSTLPFEFNEAYKQYHDDNANNSATSCNNSNNSSNDQCHWSTIILHCIHSSMYHYRRINHIKQPRFRNITQYQNTLHRKKINLD